jgi:hypothetical protein
MTYPLGMDLHSAISRASCLSWAGLAAWLHNVSGYRNIGDSWPDIELCYHSLIFFAAVELLRAWKV